VGGDTISTANSSPPHPRGQAACSGGRGNNVGHPAQHLIAGMVPVLIIDGLEMVKIEQQQLISRLPPR